MNWAGIIWVSSSGIVRPSFSSTVPEATCKPWAKVQDYYVCSICKMRVAEPPSELYGEKRLLKVRIFPKSTINLGYHP